MSATIIDIAYLENLVLGAAILGTGGGGDPKIGYLMAKQAIEKYGPVKLIKVSDLEENQFACSIAMMGAPSVALEKMPNGGEFTKALDAIETYYNKKVSAIYPIEAGGLNSMLPIVAAATLNLPLLDGDCMGRAFPQLQMISQSIYDIKNTPIVMCNEKLDTATLCSDNPNDMEHYARFMCMSYGGNAMLALGFSPKEQLDLFLIQDIVSKSYEIGRIINDENNIIETMKNELNAYHLFDGKISDLLRKYEGGFNKGHIFIDSFNGDDQFEIYLQNENLIAFTNKEVVAMVPDLICILDYQTKKPITTETLKFGQRITVIAFPCDDRWRSEKGLALVNPKVFGYDYEYVNIETLQGGNK